MPDKPATKKVSIRNDGEGPRYVHEHGGDVRVLAPGETAEGVNILQADLADLSSDLTIDPATGEAAAEPNASPKVEFKPLDGLDKAALLATAREEGFVTIAEQPTLGEADIRDAINLARETAVAEVQAEATALQKANNTDQLNTLAADEGVALEGGDTKADRAFRIAYARYQKKAGGGGE